MKNLIRAFSLAFILLGCQKEDRPVAQDSISDEVLAAVAKAGFSTEGVLREEGGYIVEGDIFLSESDLRTPQSWKTMTIAGVEQYHTNNIVSTGSGRTITVSVSDRLPASYVTAVDEALTRYNNESLTLTFTRISSRADINIADAKGSYLASAGFPNAKGDPYGSVKVNASYLGPNPGTKFLATIIAHEIGHCIGYRHTDYMDRSYSCGGAAVNEGAFNIGAIHIPGTPVGPDARSWMLSCISLGENRPFNRNDKTALDYLY